MICYPYDDQHKKFRKTDDEKERLDSTSPMKKSKWLPIGTVAFVLAVPFLLINPMSNRLKSWAGMRETDPPTAGQLQVQFIDVGNADAILIRTDDRVVMIDGGENDDETTVSDYLYRQGIEKIDLLIATHADADHIGGMDALIRNFPVDMVLHTLEADKTDVDAVALLEAIEAEGVSAITPSIKSVYELDGMVIEILGPLSLSKETNDNSIVLKLTFGDISFLFTGDASAKVEQKLMDAGADLSADVLKVSHHGSATATTEPFLRAVDPTFAVISCGKGNNHGHPDEKVMGRLAAYGVEVLRTDLHGTVILQTDGQKITTILSRER